MHDSVSYGSMPPLKPPRGIWEDRASLGEAKLLASVMSFSRANFFQLGNSILYHHLPRGVMFCFHTLVSIIYDTISVRAWFYDDEAQVSLMVR